MDYSYLPFSAKQMKHKKEAWDGLAEKRPFGRAAIVFPGIKPDFHELEKEILPADEIPLAGASQRNHEWDREIQWQLRHLHICALSRYQDDTVPALSIPRPIYGQSQGITQVFGCRLIPQANENGLFYPVPGIQNPADVDCLKLVPLEQTMYYNSIEFAKYAVESTDGQLLVKNPVMTGPIDTANYVLGTMRLMEWIYDEPVALHKLLHIITEVIISAILRLQEVAHGKICPETVSCVDRGYGLCSEVRHLLSADCVDEFETHYLKKISGACGKYSFHSCGTWERTLETDMGDPNLMIVNFQTKEMDLKKVYEKTKGKLSISFQPSFCLPEKYLWPDDESYYRHLIEIFPEPIPVEFRVGNIDIWQKIQKSTGGNLWKPSK